MKYEDIVKQVIDNSTDKTITHHGVLGMRWGYSRGRRVSGTNKAEEHESVRPQVDLSLVRTEDLQKSISRMQMEKTYNQLMDERYGVTKPKEAKVDERTRGKKILDGIDTTAKVAKQAASVAAAIVTIKKVIDATAGSSTKKYGKKTVILN